VGSAVIPQSGKTRVAIRGLRNPTRNSGSEARMILLRRQNSTDPDCRFWLKGSRVAGGASGHSGFVWPPPSSYIDFWIHKSSSYPLLAPRQCPPTDLNDSLHVTCMLDVLPRTMSSYSPTQQSQIYPPALPQQSQHSAHSQSPEEHDDGDATPPKSADAQKLETKPQATFLTKLYAYAGLLFTTAFLLIFRNTVFSNAPSINP
jgi:hypothetical protein